MDGDVRTLSELVFEVRISNGAVSFVLTMDGMRYRLVPDHQLPAVPAIRSERRRGPDTKHHRVIADVVEILAQTTQLRLTDMLDRLEAAGVDHFGDGRRRDQRLNHLRTIVNKETHLADRRIEHVRRGLYRLSSAELERRRPPAEI